MMTREEQMRYRLSLVVNGEQQELEVPANATLLDVLRDEIGLKGTKQGCGTGECGACTVLLEGEPVNSCLVIALQASGKSVVTIEGLSRDGSIDGIQEAFITHGAIQCGYCTPGMILSAKALLGKNPNPKEEEIREALIGNLCRCTGYQSIVEAIKSVRRQRDNEK